MKHTTAMAAIAAITHLSLAGVPSSVHDGDTLTLGGYNIRLFGVDAPELSEAYGIQSRDYLTLITKNQTIRCESTGAVSHDRVVARCYLDDGREINQLMVESGLALDCKHYSNGYYAKFEQSWSRNRLRNKEYCYGH